MDLLKEPIPYLQRILRRLMNHLHWQGVLESGLLLSSRPNSSPGGRSKSGRESARPRRDVVPWTRSSRPGDAGRPDRQGAVPLIKQWCGRTGSISSWPREADISLLEIKEIINRFVRSTRGDEQALSRSDDLQARIALIRRFLSERLEFIRIARTT
jgi:hypothetical protein